MGRAKRVRKGNTDQALWFKLAKHMEYTGLTKHIKSNFKLLSRVGEIEEKFAEKFPDLKDTPLFKYYTRRQLVREILKKSRWWLARWATDHRVLESHHKYMYDFFDKGYQSLPERIRRENKNQGIYIREDENASYYLVTAPRGFGKTNSFLGVEALRDILHYPKNKYLITSWQIDYAKAVVAMLRGIIFNPVLELVFPELFSADRETYTLRGGRVTKEEINIIPEPKPNESYDAMSSMRKESTFDTSALTSEKTQRHYHGVLYDDLGVKKNTRTAEQAEHINSYIDSLAGLREKNIDGNNHPFHYKGTGTYWYVPGPIDYILENKPCKAFIMPMTYQSKGNTYRLSREFTDSEIKRRKGEFGRFFRSQCYNEGMNRDDINLELNYSEKDNRIQLSKVDAEYLWNNSVHVQICDPAYSRENKRPGDGKSRFTITQALVTENITYYYDVYQSPGEKTRNIRKLNLSCAKKFDIDAFIMDAQASAQHGLAREVIDEINENHRKIWSYAHDSSPLTDTTDKLEVANEILSGKIQNKEVIVVDFPAIFPIQNRCDLISQQLSGEYRGLDIIDTIVYCEADINRDAPRRRFVNKLVNKRLVRRKSSILTESMRVIHGAAEKKPSSRRQKTKRRKRYA